MSILTIESAKKIQPNPFVLAEAKMKYTDSEYQDLIRRTDKSVKEKPAKEFDIKVLVTREPQDFWHMYSNGPRSCMTYSSTTFGNQFSWMLPFKLHPNSSLVFDQYTRGIYVKDHKDKTLFRAIAFADRSINNDDMIKLKWHFRTCYSINSDDPEFEPAREDTAIMVFLKSLNITKGKPKNTYVAEYDPITVKLDKVDEQILIFPYFDDKSYVAKLSWTGSKFRIQYGNRLNNFYSAYKWSIGEKYYFPQPKQKFKRCMTAKEAEVLGFK